jgi:hypothetical protein
VRLRVHGDPGMSVESAYVNVEASFESQATREALLALDGEQRRRLSEYWIDRASGELTTALTFEFMLEDLTEEHAPEPLLELARRALADEHVHVDWCLRWARLVDPRSPAQARFGGTRPLTFDGASEHDNRLLRTVFGCAFSETVAVHVLLASHRRITVDSVKQLNRQHLKEEVRHARLGWALLGWSGLSERDRLMIAAYVPEMLRLTRQVWTSTRRAGDEALHQAGYLSSLIVDAACDDAIAGVVLPGLERLGISAR